MSRLTVHAHGVPILCGGVVVRPGDLVFAEADGVGVVPAEVEEEEEEVVAALEKLEREDRVREELTGGATLAEVWKRHRVL
jgi:4-hydroxy-4-methyl-2-oxoglutarate aldolase